MRTYRQLGRYGLVGLLSNGILYFAYLILTHFGMGPKTAMTLLFVIGVTQTFFMNNRWTFGHRGNKRIAYARYSVAYGFGYILNLTSLAFFVDVLGYKHQIVQGMLVIGIAALLFLLQKFWVFRETPSDMETDSHQITRQ